MDELIKMLPAIVDAAGSAEEVAEAAAKAAWKHVVGESLAQNAVASGLNQKTLVVAVDDAVWQEQLESISGQLLFRLNSLLGQAAVTFIEFHIDPKITAESRQSAVVRQASPDQPAYAVPPELVAAAAWIHDKDLRRVFLGAATSCIKRLEGGPGP
jgi:hypothetical protein